MARQELTDASHKWASAKSELSDLLLSDPRPDRPDASNNECGHSANKTPIQLIYISLVSLQLASSVQIGLSDLLANISKGVICNIIRSGRAAETHHEQRADLP